jgi:hypothetical protein
MQKTGEKHSTRALESPRKIRIWEDLWILTDLSNEDQDLKTYEWENLSVPQFFPSSAVVCRYKSFTSSATAEGFHPDLGS